MQYMLTLYAHEEGFRKITKAEQEQGYAAYMAYSEALKQANVLKALGRLQPSATASTVRLVDGKPQVLDGPFIETKEQFGGYFLIDVPDLDSALAWAVRCPGAHRQAARRRSHRSRRRPPVTKGDTQVRQACPPSPPLS